MSLTSYIKRNFTKNAAPPMNDVNLNAMDNAIYAHDQAFPIDTVNIKDGAITQDKISGLTSTIAELNVLHGLLPTVTELNYVDGVSSSIQEQLDTRAKFATGTYTGTGTFGISNPTTVSVGFVPKLFLVMNQGYFSSSKLIGINPQTQLCSWAGSSDYQCSVTWGTTMSWYNTFDATKQLNSGSTYYWVAFG